MKTLVTALTAIALLAGGVGAAVARDQQTTGVEIDNMLNHESAASGPYASVRTANPVTQSQIDFQAQGSN